LTFSENAVPPLYTRVGGLGDGWIARDVMSAATFEDVFKAISIPNRAYGFSMNIGSILDKRMFNVEMSANHTSILAINGTNWEYAHVNMYRHLDVSQTPDNSSIHRMERIDQLFPMQNVTDIQFLLGDTKDPLYPIYRNSNPPDCCSTLSTAIFDLDQQIVSIYVTNPKLTTTPLKVFQL